MKKSAFFLFLAAALLAAPTLRAEQLFQQNFTDTPLSMLVDFYNEWTGRTLIIQANLDAKITLKYDGLTKDEAMQAIETVLSMNGVALIPMGEKFLKVVDIATAQQEGIESLPFDPEVKHAAADQLISQVIPLRHVIFSDVQPVVQQLLHSYGKIIQLDRINSILITDSAANISRIVDILNMLDQPLEKIEPRIYSLKYAQAGDVGGKLKELVEAAKTEGSEQVTVGNARTVPGVIRAAKTKTVSKELPDAANSEMIQGEVKFVSDERTNILIVFSKAANFTFFDNIIKVLDVPVDPEVVVETVYLEYATAKDISSILNDFVGAVTESEPTTGTATEEGGAAKSIQETIAKKTTTPKREISETGKAAIGRLSEDTKIISDERTNSLILMGRRSDINALQSVITSLDVMLEQVLIEAVILSVGLNDTLDTGVEWVYNTQESTETTTTTSTNSTAVETLAELTLDSAFSYYKSFTDIDVDLVIEAAKTDSDTRLLSSPVVLTTDNTEAQITVADERPVITSTYTGSSNYGSSSYEYKTIGIDLTVTPHINPERFVLMEITQSADDLGDDVTIDGNAVPTIQKREISATIAVQDRQTVVLGGLVRNQVSESVSRVPILGDIPLLGWLFSSHNEEEAQTELIVLITPYVLTNPEEATREAARRLKASESSDSLWPTGWSESPLKNDAPVKDEEIDRTDITEGELNIIEFEPKEK